MRGARGLLRSRVGRALAVVAVLGLGAVAAAAAQEKTSAGVLKVRLGGDAVQTRVVVELDRTVQGKLLTESDSAVVVGLPQVGAPGGMQGQGGGWVHAYF